MALTTIFTSKKAVELYLNALSFVLLGLCALVIGIQYEFGVQHNQAGIIGWGIVMPICLFSATIVIPFIIGKFDAQAVLLSIIYTSVFLVTLVSGLLLGYGIDGQLFNESLQIANNLNPTNITSSLESPTYNAYTFSNGSYILNTTVTGVERVGKICHLVLPILSTQNNTLLAWYARDG